MKITLSLLAVLAVAAAPLRAQTLGEAQAQAAKLLAARKDAQAARAKKEEAKAPAPRRLAELVCAGADKRDALSGVLDLDSLTLQNTRSEDAAPLIQETREDRVVDERCGKVVSPLSENFNYYVTPRHDWGEDILQLPKAALGQTRVSKFKAQLHTCQYDGDWHADWDAVLDCTLTALGL